MQLMPQLACGTYVCNSCAVGSIGNIGSFSNPEAVMKAFCRESLGVRDDFKPNYSKLICFYVFCAGPEVPTGQKGSSHHSKDHWPKYGTEFAQFLVNNNLGEVVTLGPKYNLKHHPTTTAQVWVWSPNQEAVEKWWDAAQRTRKIKE